MERIRIVEKVDYETFRKQYCFQVSVPKLLATVQLKFASTGPLQVGDEVEVMYFAAKTETECDEWLQAFRNGKYIHCKS